MMNNGKKPKQVFQTLREGQKKEWEPYIGDKVKNIGIELKNQENGTV